MASAPTKPENGQLPSGFVSPFKCVPMQGTHDNFLACTATLCGSKTMEDVKKVAATLGLRANGSFYLDETLFRKILFKLSNLVISDYNDFKTIAALPDVCVLCVDCDADETCCQVVFHHVRDTADVPAFSYAIDIGNWTHPISKSRKTSVTSGWLLVMSGTWRSRSAQIRQAPRPCNRSTTADRNGLLLLRG